ncbi:MAG: hypothetical protein IT515_18725 [Burkholderiales bacterium]|nr:hypothetical protein [Burkholderiales bacterium]
MSSKKKKSGATVHVANGAGGLRPVADHRFEAGAWPISESIPAAQAGDWMAHLHAESTGRGWSSSSFGQLDAEESSGSLTVHLVPGQAGPTIEVVWEKTRGGRLDIRARPGGDPAAALQLAQEFFAEVATRLRTGRMDREHRRSWLVYDGLPWTGELWLTESLRLGPPSRSPDSLLGRQVVIVDAVVEGIGFQGVSAKFQRILRELRLLLSPVLGLHVENTRWESEWVPEIDERNQITDCRLRTVGYAEIDLPPGLPARGSAPPITLETVARPGLGRSGVWPDDRAQRVPHDIEGLWRSFIALPEALKEQFLNACNAYDIARSMWPAQRTAYAVFLVVACEALKPSGNRHKKANVYDVVASLIDVPTAQSLRNLRVPPQDLRSRHVHHGALAADDIAPLLFGDPFRDPSFHEMITMLSQVTRICLVEWLRRGGRYRITWLARPEAPGKRHTPQRKRPPRKKRR